ncbi:MAG: prolyl aminopeptidase [Bdellovibrionota bacterium]
MNHDHRISSLFLPVGDGHELYIEDCGPADAFPILFMHGGPGAGFSDRDKNFFDLTTQRVIFFDQRGAGRSKPFASLENNTTLHLVQDALRILEHFELEKCMLFGGSWGSTYALSFSVAHPEKVAGMVLRGIFLGTDAENDHFFRSGTCKTFPDAFENFLSLVPKDHQNQALLHYAHQLAHADLETQKKYADAFVRFELSCAKLIYDPQAIEDILKEEDSLAFARIESHYLSNLCFLEDGYILRNIHKIKDKPISMVHGRYDAICSAKVAFELHKALPTSQLYFTVAGHASTDTETFERLKKEATRVYSLCSGTQK